MPSNLVLDRQHSFLMFKSAVEGACAHEFGPDTLGNILKSVLHEDKVINDLFPPMLPSERHDLGESWFRFLAYLKDQVDIEISRNFTFREADGSIQGAAKNIETQLLGKWNKKKAFNTKIAYACYYALHVSNRAFFAQLAEKVDKSFLGQPFIKIFGIEVPTDNDSATILSDRIKDLKNEKESESKTLELIRKLENEPIQETVSLGLAMSYFYNFLKYQIRHRDTIFSQSPDLEKFVILRPESLEEIPGMLDLLKLSLKNTDWSLQRRKSNDGKLVESKEHVRGEMILDTVGPYIVDIPAPLKVQRFSSRYRLSRLREYAAKSDSERKKHRDEKKAQERAMIDEFFDAILRLSIENDCNASLLEFWTISELVRHLNSRS